jgi:hypothetical protein
MKTKRLVAPLMALVMIVGLFAMTASAVSGITCYACKNLGGTGTENTYYIRHGWEATSSWTVDSCPYLFSKHTHSNQRRHVFENCSKHGGINDYYEYRNNYCPVAG